MPARTPDKIGECAMCNRERPLTFHHLIPRSVHKNKWFKKNFSKVEFDTGINICKMCHMFLHKQYSEKILGKEFNTLEKILAEDKVNKFITWVAKQY